LHEISHLHASYKHLFKEQLNRPNAENNHILNYSLKLNNYIMMHNLIHTLCAGGATVALKSFFGPQMEAFSINYLGEKRAQYATAVVYISLFFTATWWMDKQNRLDINYLTNARDFNGEIMANLCAKLYPHKLNMQKYQMILQEKQE